MQILKHKSRQHFISQPFSASLTMESEASCLKLTRTENPLFSKKLFQDFSVLMPIIPTPLFFEWSSTQSIDDVPCSGLKMTIAWWRKNYFSVVFVFTCYGSDFSCFDMTAKMCTAFPCHRQTYFQHACFHEESEGSISLARQ